jgi:integrase
MRPTKPYPFVYRDIDRQGAQRWRLRAPGRPTTTIKGEFGSPDFAANYRAAMEGSVATHRSVATDCRSVPSKHGTIDALVRTYLRSAAFDRLANASQKMRRRLLEGFAVKHGALPVARMERRHAELILSECTPGVSRNLLAVLRILMGIAISDGTISADPTAGIKSAKLSKDGWHTWSEDEIARFESHHPIGSQARLSLALALCTGQRASDLIVMGRQHMRDGRISVRQHKTGASLWVPIHSDLQTIIDATPSGHMTLLAAARGVPYTKANSFSKRLNRWAKEAGLAGCPLHGLRKACCRRLAEAGCSTNEIMAISGHKSLKEVERYTKAANQGMLAAAAMQKVSRT